MSRSRATYVTPDRRLRRCRRTHLEPGGWPHTERIVDAMERALRTELSLPPARRARHRWGPWCAPCKVLQALTAYEDGWASRAGRGYATRARAWSAGWEALNGRLAATLEQVAELEAIAPREVEPGEVRWRAPEMPDGIMQGPPSVRVLALEGIRAELEAARRRTQLQIEAIPEPPRKLKRAGYARARVLLAPIRSGHVQTRDGALVATGDRVTDLEIASAMLEAPAAWVGRVCVDLADSFLFDHHDDDELAARELAKRIPRALGPRETR